MSAPFPSAARLFRTRRPGRDLKTDRDRLSHVSSAIETAIESARSEREGLERRLELYYAQAVSLLEDAPEFSSRSERQEQAITEAERNAQAATLRIKQISAQIDKLQDVLSSLYPRNDDKLA